MMNSDGNFQILERRFGEDEKGLSVGLANIHARVPDLEGNRTKIRNALEVFRSRKVDMAVFPEYGLSGYFWDDPEACRAYMDGAVLENQLDWIKSDLIPLLDEDLKYLVINGIRKNPSPDRPYLNTTLVVTRGFEAPSPENTYDKIFLPGIEKDYVASGKDSRLVLETHWGRFGFVTCYDLCFPPLLTDYAYRLKVDGLIVVSSWRSGTPRDYAGVNRRAEHYYGFQWDTLVPAAATAYQVWAIACNAVGVHGLSGAEFWGGSGIYAPSGVPLVEGSRRSEELVILHNTDIAGQRAFERADFDYIADFRAATGRAF